MRKAIVPAMKADPEFLARARQIALIKAALAAVVLLIMLLTFPRPLPLLVSALDLALIPVYLWAVRRWPVAATYLLLAETALALTPRQFVQGYVNGVNWVLYIPLPLAAAYVLRNGQALRNATLLVSAIAGPIMLVAALTLPPQIGRADVLALVGYVLVVLWALLWLGRRRI